MELPIEAHAPQQVIFGVFGSSERADAVRRKLKQSERHSVIRVLSLTLIKRDRAGRVEVLEAKHGRATQQPTGPFPAILELMLGPTPEASSCSRLRGLASALSPGTSAIAALIEHRWVQDIRAVMEEAGPDTVAEAMKSEIVAALATNKDLVLTAGSAAWQLAPVADLDLAHV
jgi:hypothetical protein